jgi:hypothetical protein
VARRDGQRARPHDPAAHFGLDRRGQAARHPRPKSITVTVTTQVVILTTNSLPSHWPARAHQPPVAGEPIRGQRSGS